jgi:hypothetical protein
MDFKGDTEHAPDFESICPSLDNSTLSLITKKSTANLTKTANTSMQKSSHPSQIPASRKPPIAAAYNILNTEISIPPQKLNPSLPQQPLVQHQLQQNIVGSYFTPAAYTPQKLVSSPFIGNVSKTRPMSTNYANYSNLSSQLTQTQTQVINTTTEDPFYLKYPQDSNVSMGGRIFPSARLPTELFPKTQPQQYNFIKRINNIERIDSEGKEEGRGNAPGSSLQLLDKINSYIAKLDNLCSNMPSVPDQDRTGIQNSLGQIHRYIDHAKMSATLEPRGVVMRVPTNSNLRSPPAERTEYRYRPRTSLSRKYTCGPFNDANQKSS